MSFRIDRNSSVYMGGIAPRASGKARQCDGVSPSFDQVRISSQRPHMERRIQELTGRLSCQIRNRPTAQEITALAEQVAAGTYCPSAEEIACRMLLQEA